MILYTTYEKKSLQDKKLIYYIKAEGSSYYFKCIRRGFSSYDTSGPIPSDQRSFDKTKEALETKRQEAEAKVKRIKAAAATTYTKVKYMLVQQCFLR